MPDKVVYLETGPWPVRVGYCKSEEAWLRECRRLKIKNPPPWVSPTADATCHHYDDNDGQPISIICCPRHKGRSVVDLAGLIAHEAVHVTQDLWNFIGEKKPGAEAEAYFTQSVVVFCLRHMLSK